MYFSKSTCDVIRGCYIHTYYTRGWENVLLVYSTLLFDDLEKHRKASAIVTCITIGREVWPERLRERQSPHYAAVCVSTLAPYLLLYYLSVYKTECIRVGTSVTAKPLGL